MTYPLIGLTTYQAKNEANLPIIALLRAYLDALIQAKGIPVLIPANLSKENYRKLYRHLDGIIFTGGGDISLDLFDGEPHHSINGVDPERDSSELSLLELFVKNKKPFLGICRGFQLVNVGMGGTLFTNLEDQMSGVQKHDYYPDFPRSHLAHHVTVVDGSKLADILKEADLFVNSLHHQGAKHIPSSLTPVAYATDGLIEAVELPNHPFGIAIQWHPEWLTDQPVTRRLFQAFVKAASSYK
jgi:putative glutamine amidotransferase